MWWFSDLRPSGLRFFTSEDFLLGSPLGVRKAIKSWQRLSQPLVAEQVAHRAELDIYVNTLLSGSKVNFFAVRNGKTEIDLGKIDVFLASDLTPHFMFPILLHDKIYRTSEEYTLKRRSCIFVGLLILYCVSRWSHHN